MPYSVKEIYYTIQGEGYQTGRPAIFCRFSGCNLWSGREEDRDKAICQFCDTDFWGVDGRNGGKYRSALQLAEFIKSLWPQRARSSPFVVCTGGEPALQMDEELIEAFHTLKIQVAIETNGTIPLPRGIDWICVSPKANSKIMVRSGNELKLVYPHGELSPEDFKDWSFDHFSLQPLYGPDLKENTQACIDYCLNNPLWSLSLQSHKYIGIP